VYNKAPPTKTSVALNIPKQILSANRCRNWWLLCLTIIYRSVHVHWERRHCNLLTQTTTYYTTGNKELLLLSENDAHAQYNKTKSWSSVTESDRIANWMWIAGFRSTAQIPVTPFFDTQYLTNGYRYGHSYYRRRIGDRTQASEWHQFQWHWVTSKLDFKVTILFNVKKTRKWYKIELYLQWPTNRKSHMVYRTALFSMTLKNSKPSFQGQAILGIIARDRA